MRELVFDLGLLDPKPGCSPLSTRTANVLLRFISCLWKGKQGNEYLLSTKLVHSSLQERGSGEWAGDKVNLGQRLSSRRFQSGGGVHREERGLARSVPFRKNSGSYLYVQVIL